MERFYELLEKRRNLTANAFEEEEMIELSKKLPKEELDMIDPSLLNSSNSQRLDALLKKIDELSKKL